jgi:hypothetical protein
MSDEIQPGEDVFTADDLVDSSSDAARKHGRRVWADKTAAVVAIVAWALWLGGMIALGACAAPFVFQLTPYPFSGQAMGAAFARFDSIAITCSVIALGAEAVRTLLSSRHRQTLAVRLRRYLAMLIALGAVYTGLRLTPAILSMHNDGVRRNVGAQGSELERIHRQAELIGKVNVPIAILVIALHVFTLRSEREDDDGPVAAPRPPGAPS